MSTTIPVGFQACLENIFQAIRGVDGWLSDAEVECLALFAACPTATGEILEIGSFRGKSAIVLARAAALTCQPHVVAVDPFVLEGPTLADHNGVPSARALFEANLRQAGVEHAVELHETYSTELGKHWDRPIRLLWIDGDHTYEGARTDLETFLPFLADRAIVAFHDILHPYQCVRAFRKGVIESPHFRQVGFCGSIGWAQYTLDVPQSTGCSTEDRKLAHRLQKLERFSEKKLRGISKLNYKLRRAIITSRRIEPNEWLRRVA